ncbi:hypothetical protein U1Q18_038749, partial [Sarracenia purpurea var. burkii]
LKCNGPDLVVDRDGEGWEVADRRIWCLIESKLVVNHDGIVDDFLAKTLRRPVMAPVVYRS